jgi:hypothetical protein
MRSVPRPGEPFPADADAVAQRFAMAEHQIEKRVRCVDDDGASMLNWQAAPSFTSYLKWAARKLRLQDLVGNPFVDESNNGSRAPVCELFPRL